MPSFTLFKYLSEFAESHLKDSWANLSFALISGL